MNLAQSHSGVGRGKDRRANRHRSTPLHGCASSALSRLVLPRSLSLPLGSTCLPLGCACPRCACCLRSDCADRDLTSDAIRLQRYRCFPSPSGGQRGRCLSFTMKSKSNLGLAGLVRGTRPRANRLPASPSGNYAPPTSPQSKTASATA